MAVRRILALAMLPVFVAGGLIGSSARALAASHRTTGTYQLFQGQSPPSIWVLQRNHLVAPYDTASWGSQKNIVTVEVLGPVLPQTICIHYGQGPACSASVTFTGPKTPQGIASRSVPGLFTENAGTAVTGWGVFYAVRTGGARQGS